MTYWQILLNALYGSNPVYDEKTREAWKKILNDWFASRDALRKKQFDYIVAFHEFIDNYDFIGGVKTWQNIMTSVKILKNTRMHGAILFGPNVVRAKHIQLCDI